MMDTVTWTAEVGKREARERLAAMPYETVTSYCFSKWWLDSKRQDWWPTSRGPLKQAFGVHPTVASDTGLTHRKYEDLKRARKVVVLELGGGGGGGGVICRPGGV